MFCPSCGQQQTPEAARFCPRCGFPQYGVINLLNAGGQWPEASAAPTISPRKRGVKQGAVLFLLGMIIAPLLAILADGTGFPEGLVAAAAVIFFMGGLLRMLYAAIFEEGKKTAPTVFNAAPPMAVYAPPGQPLFAPQPQSALPPAQQQPIPASAWRSPHDTQEIITPGSVTEHTTRMLKREAE